MSGSGSFPANLLDSLFGSFGFLVQGKGPANFPFFAGGASGFVSLCFLGAAPLLAPALERVLRGGVSVLCAAFGGGSMRSFEISSSPPDVAFSGSGLEDSPVVLLCGGLGMYCACASTSPSLLLACVP